MTWAIFHKYGKWPISNKLLNNLDIENEIGVAIICINLPGIPHCENCDFLIFRINFATSIGDVFKLFNEETPSFCCKFGAGSLGLFTEDFDAVRVQV